MGDDTTHSCHEVRETAGKGDNARGPRGRGRGGGGDDDHIQSSACRVVHRCRGKGEDGGQHSSDSTHWHLQAYKHLLIGWFC
jgi:hypothetical protein